MAENSGIEWTRHTFNPWIGCTKISAACDHCYAARQDEHRKWTPEGWGGPRRRTAESTWKQPIKWDRAAKAAGERHRVFCASLADVFDNQVPPEWRRDLWELIDETPHLDWLLLTKRPQNITKGMLPKNWTVNGWPNVWLGTTVENQQEAQRRIPYLVDVPAAVHFLSCEPLLGPVDLSRIPRAKGFGTSGPYSNVLDPRMRNIDWVITGGESGPNFRHADPDWFRSLRDQCAEYDVPFLFKQWEGKTPAEIKALGRELDGVVHDGYPACV